VAAIEAKEAEAEALKVKLVEAPEFSPDRAALRRAGLAYVGPLASGDAPAVRTILRRLNVERITVIPDGPKGWRFESNVDLAGLLGQDGNSGGPPNLPRSETSRRSRAAPLEFALRPGGLDGPPQLLIAYGRSRNSRIAARLSWTSLAAATARSWRSHSVREDALGLEAREE
jgi:hypothetical protein